MDCDLAGKENISMNPTVKEYLIDAWDKYRAQKRKKNEIKKFKDCRRKEVYEKVLLTDAQKEQIDEFYTVNYGKKSPTLGTDIIPLSQENSTLNIFRNCFLFLSLNDL